MIKLSNLICLFVSNAMQVYFAQNNKSVLNFVLIDIILEKCRKKCDYSLMISKFLSRGQRFAVGVESDEKQGTYEWVWARSSLNSKSNESNRKIFGISLRY